MRRFLARFSEPVWSGHVPSWADFITTTPELKFSVHTKATAWIWRLVLVALVAGLAVINAVGVYARLVAAHVGDRGAATSAVETQEATLAARMDVATHNVADLDRRLAQIDTAIEEAAKRGKTRQRKARAGLVDERKREAGALAALQTERATVAAKGRQIETEAAPIRYVAAVLVSRIKRRQSGGS
jgi:hypothetical protein